MTIAYTDSESVPPELPTAPGLVQRLADALTTSGTAHCQWKGHRKCDQWMRGLRDIDLLVSRTDAARLTSILGRLGFKRAHPPVGFGLPGLESYLGHDPSLPRLVHVDVHYRLVIGFPWSTSYVLPLDRAVLASAREGPVFRIPAPEFELLLLVLRLTLRYRARDVVLRPRPRWLAATQEELRTLADQVPRARLAEVLAEHLPCVDARLFERCRRSLHLNQSPLSRYRAARALRARLAAFARRPRLVGVLMTLADRIGIPLGGRGLGRPAVGGVLALLGGDGAGKTTCARALTEWLSSELATLHVHLGRPPRSALTLVVGAALKVSEAVRRLGSRLVSRPARRSSADVGYLELLRYICTARDRYRLYRRAHRFAAKGGVVIAERYPMPVNYFLAGPSAAQGRRTRVENRVTRLLRRLETRYYDLMVPPEASIVLQVDPETAVRRKPEEPADYVRARARVIKETNWAQVNGAHAIDVERAFPEVLHDLKSLVWSLL